MIFGVTGSRHDVPENAATRLREFLRKHNATELHHGDCVGFDALAHDVALSMGLSIVIHPPINGKYRAWCDGGVIMPPAEYLQRNRAIVDACEMLIAAPNGPETLRSGTWSTIRYARKRGVPRAIMTRTPHQSD